MLSTLVSSIWLFLLFLMCCFLLESILFVLILCFRSLVLLGSALVSNWINKGLIVVLVFSILHSKLISLSKSLIIIQLITSYSYTIYSIRLETTFNLFQHHTVQYSNLSTTVCGIINVHPQMHPTSIEWDCVIKSSLFPASQYYHCPIFVE